MHACLVRYIQLRFFSVSSVLVWTSLCQLPLVTGPIRFSRSTLFSSSTILSSQVQCLCKQSETIYSLVLGLVLSFLLLFISVEFCFISHILKYLNSFYIVIKSFSKFSCSGMLHNYHTRLGSCLYYTVYSSKTIVQD